MNFDQYWQRLCEKNANLKDESNVMRITVESFKKALRQAFEVDKEQAKKASDFLDKLFR